LVRQAEEDLRYVESISGYWGDTPVSHCYLHDEEKHNKHPFLGHWSLASRVGRRSATIYLNVHSSSDHPLYGVHLERISRITSNIERTPVLSGEGEDVMAIARKWILKGTRDLYFENKVQVCGNKILSQSREVI